MDGVLRLQLPLSADNPLPSVWFGDQGWEGGETYFQSVRYGTLSSVPEPAGASLLLAASLALLLKRRTIY